MACLSARVKKKRKKKRKGKNLKNNQIDWAIKQLGLLCTKKSNEIRLDVSPNGQLNVEQRGDLPHHRKRLYLNFKVESVDVPTFYLKSEVMQDF